MRELVYFVAVSLDGRIAAPDDTFADFPQQGDHIDAILRDWTDTVPAIGLRALGLEADNARFDTVLMGWNTYAAGLGATDDPYPHLEQIVFSRSHSDDDVPAGIRVTADDPVDVVRDLRSRPGGDVWLCGGGLIAARLLGEIDRMVLKVNPVVLGAGKALFEGGGYDPHAFELVESTRYESGVVIGDYRRAG